MKLLLRRPRPFKTLGYFLLILVFLSTLVTPSVLAMSEAKRRMFDENNIIFYDPDKYQPLPNSPQGEFCIDRPYVSEDGSFSGGGSGSCVVTNGKNYKGDEVFTPEEKRLINQYRPIYEAAVKGTGVPWTVVAVLHNMETGLSRKNPVAPGGLGVASGGLFGIIMPDYWAGAGLSVPTPGTTTSDAEFLAQAKLAVSIFLEKASYNGGNGTIRSDSDIKRGLFGYNGVSDHYVQQASKVGFKEPQQAFNGEGSVYVMNRCDEKRDISVCQNHSEAAICNNNTWVLSDYGYVTTVFNSFGTYVQFLALGGFSGSGPSGGTSITSGTSGTTTMDNTSGLPYCDEIGTDGGFNSGSMGDISKVKNGDPVPDFALKLAQQFIVDTNKTYGTSYKVPKNMVIGQVVTTPDDDSPVGGGSCWDALYCGQCTALSGWFVTNMTKYTYGSGNGNQVVNNLLATNSGTDIGLSRTPKPFSVFSWSRSSVGNAGHTGVILDFIDSEHFLYLHNNADNANHLAVSIGTVTEFNNTYGATYADLSRGLKTRN